MGDQRLRVLRVMLFSSEGYTKTTKRRPLSGLDNGEGDDGVLSMRQREVNSATL